MHSLTIGKLSGLQRSSTPGGVFTCLALDHRQNLRKALNPVNPSQVTDTALTQFKLEVTHALADGATAVILDPQYSAAQAIAAGVIPKQTGLVVATEATGYTGDPNARRARILPGWSVEKARRMGADGVKLLVYYHPEADTAAETEQFTAQVAEECAKNDLMIMLEPLSYSLDPQAAKLSSAEKRTVVIETARRLSGLGIDLIKVEFPGDPLVDADEASWAEACGEISAVSKTPWILLSAAVDFELYKRQVQVACKAGAAGIAVGRAVWKEAVEMAPDERMAFLGGAARTRLAELAEICAMSAHPWTNYYTAPPLSPTWYLDSD